MIGGSEVALQREALLEFFVTMEFGAVVESDCLEAGLVSSIASRAACVTEAVVRDSSFLIIAKPDFRSTRVRMQ